MAEDRDHLIEIGDPEDDRAAPGPAPDPHVVIEYRDRGLPWMLVLPLLVTAAAVAIIGFKAFDDRIRPAPALPSVAEIPPPPQPATGALALNTAEAPVPEPTPAPAPSPAPAPVAEAPAPAPVAEAPAPASPEVAAQPASPFEIPPEVPATPPANPPASPVEVAAETPAPSPPAGEPEANPAAEPAPPAEEPRPFPKVAGLGFDLDALSRVEVKPDDVRPAANPAVVAGGPAAVPDDPNQPRTVDPGVLPPDPRQAQRDRVRRLAELKKRVDAERSQFHAELRALYKRLGPNSAPAIAALCNRYGAEPDPVAKALAARMLSVAAAGVDPKVRIRLLRSYGFSEAAILLDIVETKGRWEDGSARNGPRTRDDILRRAAVFLMQCPPGQATASPASASAPGRPVARPAGPAR